MSLFTVEVVTAAAPTETAMEQLRRFLDLVPGTVLIEDPVEPHLMFPIEAATPFEAVRFVDGLAKIADLTIGSGRVYETPYEEFGITDKDGDDTTEVVTAVREWMGGIREPESRLDEGGRLVAC